MFDLLCGIFCVIIYKPASRSVYLLRFSEDLNRLRTLLPKLEFWLWKDSKGQSYHKLYCLVHSHDDKNSNNRYKNPTEKQLALSTPMKKDGFPPLVFVCMCIASVLTHSTFLSSFTSFFIQLLSCSRDVFFLLSSTTLDLLMSAVTKHSSCVIH